MQRARPDVVLLNEFDYVPDGRAADLFRDNYLEVAQGGARPIEYRYAYVAPSNTGVPSGFDLNNDGTMGGGDDALGFGAFEGQYGMVVLSRFPIDTRVSARSRSSSGRTCPARSCRTTRPPPPRPTGSRPRSWTSSGCRASRTGTSR
ncbi:endonuclease/exonuclease/phosphatase family protein [Oerskovia sp. M15]